MLNSKKEEIANEQLRKKLWIDVYVAYVSSSNSTNKEGGASWADHALECFDKKFKDDKKN